MKLAHMKAVAHDIAHHAQSTVSPLAFTLYRVCRKADVRSVTLDLQSFGSYPEQLPAEAGLVRALADLRATFARLLASRGSNPNLVA